MARDSTFCSSIRSTNTSTAIQRSGREHIGESESDDAEGDEEDEESE
jgi:hypothetical protein